jgi:hypothetical protein
MTSRRGRMIVVSGDLSQYEKFGFGSLPQYRLILFRSAG